MKSSPQSFILGGTFNKNISLMWGVLSFIVAIKVIERDSVLSLFTVVSFLLYKIIEDKLQIVMEKMTTSSSFYFETPYFLIPWGILIFIFSMVGFAISYFHTIKQDSFYLTFLASLLSSLSIFSLSTSLKCFLIGTKLVNFKYIRRGFFGVFIRVFILLRNVFCSYRWLCYFAGIWPMPRLVTFIGSTKTTACYMFIVMKCVLLLWLLWDFVFSIRKYNVNSTVAFKNASPEQVVDDCVICTETPVEPIILPCGHIFCYECAYRWLMSNPTCPICRHKVAEQMYIELNNGHVPISALLSVF